MLTCSVVSTLFDRMDYSQPGSSVHGILQASKELGCPLWLCAYLWVTAGPLWSKAHCFVGWSKHKGDEESRPLKGRVTE